MATIECTFRLVQEFPMLGKTEGSVKFRSGRYHQSNWRLGSGRHAVAVYIEGNFCGIPEVELISGCLEHLNQPRPRKIRYGVLTNFNLQLNIDKLGRPFLSGIVLTDQKKNPNFWGEAYKL